MSISEFHGWTDMTRLLHFEITIIFLTLVSLLHCNNKSLVTPQIENLYRAQYIIDLQFNSRMPSSYVKSVTALQRNCITKDLTNKPQYSSYKFNVTRRQQKAWTNNMQVYPNTCIKSNAVHLVCRSRWGDERYTGGN